MFVSVAMTITPLSRQFIQYERYNGYGLAVGRGHLYGSSQCCRLIFGG
jgi:hypothetical protein